MKYKIYKATAPNGRSYIGMTSKSLDERKYYHFYFSRKGAPYAFNRAIIKYRENAFSWVILKETDTLSQAVKFEKNFISKFNTFIKGYNCSPGGVSPNFRRGYKLKNQHKERISKALLGHISTLKGTNLTIAHKCKIAESKGGKPFYSINRTSGVKTLWKTLPSCMQHFNMKSKGTLWACLTGRKLSYKNHEFRYANGSI